MGYKNFRNELLEVFLSEAEFDGELRSHLNLKTISMYLMGFFNIYMFPKALKTRVLELVSSDNFVAIDHKDKESTL